MVKVKSKNWMVKIQEMSQGVVRKEIYIKIKRKNLPELRAIGYAIWKWDMVPERKGSWDSEKSWKSYDESDVRSEVDG